MAITRYIKKFRYKYAVILLIMASFLIACPAGTTEPPGSTDSPGDPPGTTDPTVISIEVTQYPFKITYYLNDSFDDDGLIVTAHYSDNTSKTVSGYSLSAPDMSTVGTKSITATYENKTAGFTIVVYDGTGDLDIILY